MRMLPAELVRGDPWRQRQGARRRRYIAAATGGKTTVPASTRAFTCTHARINAQAAAPRLRSALPAAAADER